MKGKRKVQSPTVAEPEGEVTVKELTSRSRWLTFTELELVLRLKAEGRPQNEIAKALSRSESTISEALRRMNATPALVQSLMAGHTYSALQQWKRATKVAAKRGDHRPAREWIEAAHPELRPQQGNNGQPGGVTVIIGMPGAPVKLPDIQIAAKPIELPDKLIYIGQNDNGPNVMFKNRSQPTMSTLEGRGQPLIPAGTPQLIEAKPDIAVGETRPKP